MIEKYGLFDSLEGDERVYAEVDFARLGRALGLDGVRGGEDALKVSASASGLGVAIAPGLALIQGRYYELEDDGSGEKTLSLSAASANPRIDRIVLTLNTGERTVALEVLKGTEAASPSAPALTRDAARWMISLAQVYVAVGAGALTDEAITDERTDEALCGLHVTSADAAMNTAKAAKATADGAIKRYTHDDFATTDLIEIYRALPSGAIFLGDASRYYSNANNNLPTQYGLITILSLRDMGPRKRMILNHSGSDPLYQDAREYIAGFDQDDTAITWYAVYNAKHKPTPAAIGAIPTVTGAAEGDLPVLDASGNLASSGVSRSNVTFAKMTLSGTTLTITTTA